MAKTIASIDVTPEVRDLVDKLNPWPLSNEEAWYIVDDHLKDLVLAKRAHKISAACWKGLAVAAMEALRAQPGDHRQKLMEFAFRMEEDLCGTKSSAASGASSTPKPKG